jgi:hypothetical protein
MRCTLIVLAAAGLLFPIAAKAASFSIVSGTVHAQAALSGVPPTTDTPANVTLGPSLAQGTVSANVPSQVPPFDGGAFTSMAGVSLNSASFSISGHGKGNGGALLQSTGSGSGSIDLIFNLDAPAQVHFVGSNDDGFLRTAPFNVSATLSSGGNTISTFPFTAQDNNSASLDFVQVLPAGAYELTASGSISGSINPANVSETITATIVPEPAGLLIAAIAPLCVRRRGARAKII